MIWIGILLSLATAVALLIRRGDGPGSDPAWGEFERDAEALDKVILRVARPLSGTLLVRQRGGGSATRSLEAMLKAGRTYGASLEIFISAAVACSLGAAGLLLLGLGLRFEGVNLLLCTGFASLLAAYPWNKVVSKARSRTAEINAALPDFIELLVMVLPSTSPLPALAFTADRADGPVASEIRALVRTVSSRGVATDLEAFDMATERLATPEARTFVTTLKNAYLEGTPAIDSLVQQGEAMRRALFQRQRAQAKRMPTTLVIVFAMHFMPMLIVLALLPVVVGLGQGL
jgi:Flp pilus assembly protein TadB